ITDKDSSGVSATAEIFYRGDFEILDHGFVWSTRSDVEIETGDSVSLGKLGDIETFSARVTKRLTPNTYFYLKAFVKTADLTVYGNPLRFSDSRFQGIPKILDFNPKMALVDDVVEITTKDLPPSSGGIKVFFGEVEANIIGFYQERLEVEVPTGLPRQAVPLKLQYKNWSPFITEEMYKPLSPIISSIEPTSGTFGDTLSIIGENFHSNKDRNTVRIGSQEVGIIDVSPNLIKVQIPFSFTQARSLVYVVVQTEQGISPQEFRLLGPEITNISPAEAPIRREVIIEGNYFHPSRWENQVRLGNKELEVNYSTNDRISINIPDEIYAQRSNYFEVVVAGQTARSPIPFKISSNWIKKRLMPLNSPNAPRNKALGYAINGTAYVGMGGANYKDLYKFDTATVSLSRLTNFPGTASIANASFAIGNDMYVGMGKNTPQSSEVAEFYVYESLTDQWRSIAPYPGTRGDNLSKGFSIGNKGYVLSSMVGTPNLYEYDPATNSWTTKANWPISEEGIEPEIAQVINGKAYIITGLISQGGNRTKNDIWEYDPSSNSWALKGQLPRSGEKKTAYVLQDKLYVTFNNLSDVLEYDPRLNSWNVIFTQSNYGLRDATALGIGDRAYLFGGEYSNGANDLIFEFILNP
ncbi:MAG: IPT/TIG domain-containing protein, partial [Bacteroidota bacterium]